MNNSIIFDFLISKSYGDIFYYDGRTCQKSLLLEVLLRGFQIRNLNPSSKIGRKENESHMGRGYGEGAGQNSFENGGLFFPAHGLGKGHSKGAGDNLGSGNIFGFVYVIGQENALRISQDDGTSGFGNGSGFGNCNGRGNEPNDLYLPILDMKKVYYLE